MDEVEKKGFPILHAGLHQDCPKTIPWEVIEPHEDQAKRNHSQSLKRLAERGGLDPLEIYAVLSDWNWDLIKKYEVTIEEAIYFLNLFLDE